jgi:hypothetical protein
MRGMSGIHFVWRPVLTVRIGFHMSAEGEAHGGKHLVREILFAA